MTPSYTIAFDIGKSGPLFLLYGFLGLICFSAGIGLIFFKRPIFIRFPFIKRHYEQIKFFNIALLVFAPVLTIAFVAHYIHFLQLYKQMKSGSASIVAGRVEHFVPMPSGGHSMESFSVNGHFFSYSDYQMTCAFNNTSSHGGPIRDGLLVRITYIDNNILRLETSQ